MSMVIVSSSASSLRRRGALRGVYPSVAPGDDVSLVGHTAGADILDLLSYSDYGKVGSPQGLGILYAQYPLATLFGLLAVGWAGGYFTWRMLGRR
jgi:hypothetical protein